MIALCIVQGIGNGGLHLLFHNPFDVLVCGTNLVIADFQANVFPSIGQSHVAVVAAQEAHTVQYEEVNVIVDRQNDIFMDGT